jgi:Mg2+ and Co2+ transporter CorA
MVGEGTLMAKKLKRIVDQLEQRITAIERALASSRAADAAPESKASSEIDKAQSVETPVRKRSLSPEARQRISAAQRKRWAVKRKTAKKATKKRAA